MSLFKHIPTNTFNHYESINCTPTPPPLQIPTTTKSPSPPLETRRGECCISGLSCVHQEGTGMTASGSLWRPSGSSLMTIWRSSKDLRKQHTTSTGAQKNKTKHTFKDTTAVWWRLGIKTRRSDQGQRLSSPPHTRMHAHTHPGVRSVWPFFFFNYFYDHYYADAFIIEDTGIFITLEFMIDKQFVIYMLQSCNIYSIKLSDFGTC